MIRLGLDTSTLTLALALEIDEEIHCDRQSYYRRGHSRALTSEVEQILSLRGLSPSDVDEIVVGLGPGSFTGIRIGHAFARGLAFSNNATLRGAPSFAGFAAQLPPGGRIACAVDARKREVYAGVWTTGPAAVRIMPERAFSPEAFAARVTDATERVTALAGNGFTAYAQLSETMARFGEIPTTLAAPSAGAMLLWDRHHRNRPARTEPLYIRPSDAELNPNVPMAPPSGIPTSSK